MVCSFFTLIFFLFSFKTKGNLTKHEKSKSHYKKCLSTDGTFSSQGYDPNNSNQSDANNTEDNDSEDDCMDSDSADDNEMATSVDTESESVEKEIAQSLLDLSRATGSVIKDSPKSRKSNILIRHHNSSSSDSTADLPSSHSCSLLETPIDLTVKRKEDNLNERSPSKLKNVQVKSIGIVSEAQMWDPDSPAAGKACLNLTTVRNIAVESNVSLSASPELIDIKPEISTLHINPGPVHEKNATAIELKGNERSEISSISNSSQGAISAISPVASSSSKGAEKAPKLHQPWLPSQENSALPNDKHKTREPECSESRKEVSSEPVATISHSESPQAITVMEPRMDVDMANSKVMASVTIRPQAEFRPPSGAQALVK